MKKEIVNYLLECGVRPKLLGFAYLCRAVEMTIENGCVLPKMTKKSQNSKQKLRG